MRVFGLIGYPLGHSFSQRYFTEKFAKAGILDARYELFPLADIQGFPQLLENQPKLCGLNVTIPHKERVIPFLDELDETAQAVGAVNCIRIKDGRLTGFNTDVIGFEQSFLPLFNRQADAQALVLGTGGAAKAVKYVLQKLNIPFWVVSRQATSANELSYADLRAQDFSRIHYIFNTTPLGMAPNTDACPDLPFELLSDQHLVYDLVYNPAQTLLLHRALERGCAVKNGLDMLYKQAEAAWDNWNREA